MGWLGALLFTFAFRNIYRSSSHPLEHSFVSQTELNIGLEASHWPLEFWPGSDRCHLCSLLIDYTKSHGLTEPLGARKYYPIMCQEGGKPEILGEQY